MAMFQGENTKFLIKISDDSGTIVDPSSIRDITASLYLESNYKRYVHWILNPEPNDRPTYNLDGLYDYWNIDSGPNENLPTNDGYSRNMVDNGSTGSDGGFELFLQSADTLIMPPGRYIIQITYNTIQGGLDGGENSTQKGALLTLKKALV